MPTDIAVFGLGVMGANIALNLAEHGHQVTVYNHTRSRTEAFMARVPDGFSIVPSWDLAQLAASLVRPRCVFLMVTAGPAVDRVIESLLPHLEAGDIVIDGGNSHYPDSLRRQQELDVHGIHFVGMGISGGETGARHGPSIMPGGDARAWPRIESIFRSIAARADDGEPCVRWIGTGGAGHYVKMVHNGIEYGDMQLIAEAWQLLHEGIGIPAAELAAIFTEWNRGPLNSYLIEITAAIARLTEADGTLRVDNILDSAGQKGTGRWTAIDALQLGVPLTLISEAVFARALSALVDERTQAAARLATPRAPFKGDRTQAITAVRDALYAAKIISYTQGFMQLRDAATENAWDLNFGDIALLWRAGCIIRSGFLDAIKAAFDRQPRLQSLLLDDFFADAVTTADPGWRQAVGMGIGLGIPLPALSSALAFYDGYRSARLPANLLQAQRDYFGAHTYQRRDRPPAERYHTFWETDGHEERVDG